MTFEPRDGISVGAVEKFLNQHQVSADTDLALARLSTVLEWKSKEFADSETVRLMGAFLASSFSHFLSAIRIQEKSRIAIEKYTMNLMF